MALFIVKPRYEAFRLDWADLLCREIKDAQHESANQFLCLVQICNLRAGLSDAVFVSEIDLQNIGWLSSFGKLLCRNDLAHAKFHFEKVFE